MFSKRTWLVVSVLLVLAMALSACGKAASTAAPAETTAPVATDATGSCGADEFCFGILLVGPYNDNGWSTATYLGAQYVTEKMSKVRFLYADNVNTSSNPNTTAAQFAEQLLARGAKVIIFNSDDMKDGVTEFTAAHPDVPVIWLTGDFAWKDGQRYQADMKSESDLMGRMEYGKMIAGCAAALTTKTGKIGFLGPLINDETRRLADSAYLGANYCWTKVMGNTTPLDFKVTWIGMWFNIPGVTLDPTQVADDFYNSGYDVVISGIDSTEAVTEAKKMRDQGKDVYAVQYDYEDALQRSSGCLPGRAVLQLGCRHAARDPIRSRWKVYSPVCLGEPDWKDINNADTSVVGFKKSDGLSADAQQSSIPSSANWLVGSTSSLAR